MKENNFSLGVLGLGNRSTLFYVNALNAAVNTQEKDFSTFPFVLYNIDFNTINPYLPNDFEVLLPALSNVLLKFENLPISHLLIPNITIHEAFNRLSTPLKLIHPLYLCTRILKQKNKSSAVVFGTRYTMISNYFINYFASEGIKILSPSEEDMQFLDLFRQKIYSNTETKSDNNNYQKVLQKYGAISTVILACTELSVIYSKTDKLNVIDLTTLQIDEALRLYNISTL